MGVKLSKPPRIQALVAELAVDGRLLPALRRRSGGTISTKLGSGVIDRASWAHFEKRV